MIKILFLIHDLGSGGAERVLVNLINRLDRDKFDVTLISVFGGGINEGGIDPHIKYRYLMKSEFRGNSKVFKLLSPEKLHQLMIKTDYDIEVSFLEGPCARIISGSKSKNKVCWIHSVQTKESIKSSFRNYKEAIECYSKFEQLIFVSQGVKTAFEEATNISGNLDILLNPIDSEFIIEKSNEYFEYDYQTKIRLVAIGTLKKVKGYDRMLRIIQRLKNDGYDLHLDILGAGPMEDELRTLAANLSINEIVHFRGFQENPYKYIKNADILLSASYYEGYSSVVAESLIIGTPVCAPDIPGMYELVGENDLCGLITKNSEHDLYYGIKYLLDNPSVLFSMRSNCSEMKDKFDIWNSVRAIEIMFEKMLKNKNN